MVAGTVVVMAETAGEEGVEVAQAEEEMGAAKMMVAYHRQQSQGRQEAE